MRGYPDRPADRPRELAAFIAACDPFQRAVQDPDRPVRVHTWMAAPTEMGRRRWPVPVIDDLAALAGWLGVTPGHLAWFADRRSLGRTAADERLRHHHRRWLRKADGSARLLEAPKRELKDLQRQVLHHILDRIPPHEAAHGFRPGRLALTAARLHAGRAVVLHFDLESFFTTVGAGRVHGIFRLAGYPEPVAHTLAGLCTTVTPQAVLRTAPPATRPATAGQARAAAVERRRRMLAHLAGPHWPRGRRRPRLWPTCRPTAWTAAWPASPAGWAPPTPATPTTSCCRATSTAGPPSGSGRWWPTSPRTRASGSTTASPGGRARPSARPCSAWS